MRRTLAELPDEFAVRRIVEDGSGSVQVRGNVVEREGVIRRTRTENPLRARDLPVENFVADTGRIAVGRADGPANTRQQDLRSGR